MNNPITDFGKAFARTWQSISRSIKEWADQFDNLPERERIDNWAELHGLKRKRKESNQDLIERILVLQKELSSESKEKTLKEMQDIAELYGDPNMERPTVPGLSLDNPELEALIKDMEENPGKPGVIPIGPPVDEYWNSLLEDRATQYRMEIEQSLMDMFEGKAESRTLKFDCSICNDNGYQTWPPSDDWLHCACVVGQRKRQAEIDEE